MPHELTAKFTITLRSSGMTLPLHDYPVMIPKLSGSRYQSRTTFPNYDFYARVVDNLIRVRLGASIDR